MTGLGMGNFKYTFHLAHYDDPTFMRFNQAHNDYLELLYDTGIVGFALFMTMIFVFFRDRLIKFWEFGVSNAERALISGVTVMCVTALGTFIWQIGTTVFYTVVFAGLLYNQEVENA
jgi:O-antigen ligase